jgi:hypothetical protein
VSFSYGLQKIDFGVHSQVEGTSGRNPGLQESKDQGVKQIAFRAIAIHT